MNWEEATEQAKRFSNGIPGLIIYVHCAEKTTFDWGYKGLESDSSFASPLEALQDFTRYLIRRVENLENDLVDKIFS